MVNYKKCNHNDTLPMMFIRGRPKEGGIILKYFRFFGQKQPNILKFLRQVFLK